MYDRIKKQVLEKRTVGNSIIPRHNKIEELHGNKTNSQFVFQRSHSFPLQFERRMGKDLKSPAITFGSPSPELIDHLKAIWSQSGGAGPTGGHWKKGMIEKWGEWHNNEEGADNGVYCKDGAKIKGDKPTLGLKTYTIKKGRKISGSKGSSFWPANWDKPTLSSTLKDSNEINVTLSGGRKQWVSQKPDPIVWESYNKDTAYPIKPN
jgi:hypothetical protein